MSIRMILHARPPFLDRHTFGGCHGECSLTGTDNIRDVIAFPKTQSVVDLMMDAPSPVEEGQLEELGFQLRAAGVARSPTG